MKIFFRIVLLTFVISSFCIAFLVTYDIRYKPEAENLVTEESGIKTKYFVLIETEKGWLIDSIGY